MMTHVVQQGHNLQRQPDAAASTQHHRSSRVRRARTILLSRIVKRINFERRITLNGESVLIPIRQGVGVANLRPHEPWLAIALRRLLAKSQGVFLDVGINIGQTLLKVKTIEPSRQYFGFEPNPACCNYCDELVRVNRFKAVSIIPAALSDRTDIVDLLTRRGTDDCGSVIPGFRPAHFYSSQQPVVTVNGDVAISKITTQQLAVVKVDVEGGELEVLRGLSRLLHLDRPYILCEILPLWSEREPEFVMRQSRQAELLSLMSDLRYQLFRLLADCTVVPLRAIDTHADLRLSNYAFVPAEQRDGFVGMFPNARH